MLAITAAQKRKFTACCIKPIRKALMEYSNVKIRGCAVNTQSLKPAPAIQISGIERLKTSGARFGDR